MMKIGRHYRDMQAQHVVLTTHSFFHSLSPPHQCNIHAAFVYDNNNKSGVSLYLSSLLYTVKIVMAL